MAKQFDSMVLMVVLAGFEEMVRLLFMLLLLATTDAAADAAEADAAADAAEVAEAAKASDAASDISSWHLGIFFFPRHLQCFV